MKKGFDYKYTEKFTKEVINEILEVKDEKGLTAENLLERAKDKNSPIHNFFEWDNSQAAEKWRIYQARLIINSVQVIVNSKEMYAFENVQINVNDLNEETKREYKPIVEILSTEEYRNQVISSALESISYWRNKYKEYNELDVIFKVIDKVKQKWEKKKK
ncbi:MAG: hypothetical protein M0R17_06000 [Candidatus Omnitrophica bacterium]|jgi:hypothetical protein|nr:hypothetical protein [Candidatus Omnitrophota bacterium]